jgi:hypothetical protein
MKRRNQTTSIQMELYCEPERTSRPTLLDLPADQLADLERLIGELLLKAVSESVEDPAGGEHDA